MAVADNPIYTPTPPTIGPQTEDGRNLADWMQRELRNISNALTNISRLQMVPVARPPATPRDGLIMVADGVNWKPLRNVDGSVNKNFVGYRDGVYVQMDLGKVWRATDPGFFSGKTTNSGQPAFDMVNDANDSASAAILTAKSRNLGNPINGDNLFTIINYASISGVHQPAAAYFVQQGGAISGNNCPTNLIWQTSDVLGQLDHNMVFDNGGNLTVPNNITSTSGVVKGSFLQGYHISGAVVGFTGTALTLPSSTNFLILSPTAAFTLTMPIFTAGSWVLVKTIANFAVNSASSNIASLATDTVGTTILPATAGKWALLTSDGAGLWYIMAAN